MQKIVMYGADWCSDCQRAKYFFKTYNVPYEFHDTDNEEGAIDKVMELNNGNQSIPVILFEDNSILVEPTYEQLQNKLGL